MRLGIFGGSFDPVHKGHLALARACQLAAALDEVWFTPTAIQPLKHRGPHATDVQRVEMLNLAIENEVSEPGRGHHPSRMVVPRLSWRVCTLEIDRGGLSYTVDTLRQIHVELPEAELFFLLGADALRDVPQWREPAEIFRLAVPLIVHRAGQPEPDLAALTPLCTDETGPRIVEMPLVDISSSEIRRRIAAGQSIANLVPPAVAAYIGEHDMYSCQLS
ncbi:MAG: nicotinate-nicotinamide nucleotide adenylyltransferase [Pirellulales bacterium]